MSKIVFKINDVQYEVDGSSCGPDVSLNEFIRARAGLRGTKAMCHEGGCGACVVGVRHQLATFAVNSCLVAALQCHGWEVSTVEALGGRSRGYHQLQSRLASFNATQCGYCTPGWIMSMYSLSESKNGKLSMVDIENSFAANMCRCTGYRPIADALKSFATDADERLLEKVRSMDVEDLDLQKCGSSCSKKCVRKHPISCSIDNDWCILEQTDSKMIVVDCGTHKWYKAFTLDDVFKAMNNGEYKLVAGNTGQGVYHVTDYPPNVIDIFSVGELKGHTIDLNLILGAGMPLAEMMELFQKISQEKEEFFYLRQFYDHMDLVAHIPVRNIGTIGGNLFLKHSNNSFQSDLFVLFETIGTMVTIAGGVNQNTQMTLPDFLKQDMNKKVMLNVVLPPLSKTTSIKTYKIMPRAQNAHAVVNAGFLFKFKQNSIIEKATIVYGSISPSFIHASKTEAILAQKDLYDNETLKLALRTLKEEIVPEEAPPEPSAEYRKMLAIALFYKAILSLCPNDKVNPKYKSGGEVMKRNLSQGSQTFDSDKSLWPLNQPIPKIEALVQCSGEATFANDLPGQQGEVFGAFVTADVMPGNYINGFDPSEALKIPGVIAFYTAKDIPGVNTFIPSSIPFPPANKEEVLCEKVVSFYGQPAGIIVADREKTANKAAKLVKVDCTTTQISPLLTIDDVLKSPQRTTRVVNDKTVEPTDTGNNVQHTIDGEFSIGTQYHYTMETQTSVARPTEDGMEVYASTQWLDLTNNAIAECLNVPANSVNVIVRRVGGGYGSKISRATQIACAAALVTHLQGKSCRFILPLETNMKCIGKRMPTDCKFNIGVNDEGEIQFMKHTFYQDCGCSLNEPATAITLEHFRNCYDTRRWRIEANSVLTDTPSNTYCRAPSSTEGVAMIEYIMEKIAFETKKDPLQVRLNNMIKENNPIPDMIQQLKTDSNYDQREAEIKTFNNENRWRKRALKMVPLTFGIMYYGNYNSIVSVYHTDGSVVITHAGIEMGQGLNTKVAQVCAYKLGIPIEKISVKPSQSFTSPNAMVTGGSIGSELVSYATLKACEIILQRLEPIKENSGASTWSELIAKAYNAGVDLQASYMYSAAKDTELKSYPVYAVCALEVEVDILTGNHDVRRVDLLEDTGRSLSPEIDVAQIEGALVMGLGYWTSEKIVYNKSNGELLTDRTWTYKPPGMKDIPADMRIYFTRNGTNATGVLQSKATGEPALCLATVVIHAIREAVHSARLDAGKPDQWTHIANPCTVENIFMAVGNQLDDFVLM